MQVSGLVFFIFAISVGYFSVRFHFVSDDAERVIPQIMINVCYPAMILSSFSKIDVKVLTASGVAVPLVTITITLALYLLSGLVTRRVEESRRPVLRFQMGIGNITYVAIPLLSIFLGQQAVVAAVLHGTSQDIVIWSLYFALFAGFRPDSGKTSIRRILLNPCILALLVSVLLKLLRFELPAVLLPTVEGLAAITTPLALLYLGMLLQQNGLFCWIKNRAAIRYAIYKTLLLPAAVTLILLPFLPRQTAILLGILFGSPAPIASIVWARAYGCDATFAVASCVCSTLFYLVFMSAALFALASFGILIP